MKKPTLFILLFALILILNSCTKQPAQEQERTQEETVSVTLSTRELADEVLASISFPAMTEHTSQTDIETFIGISFDNIEEITCLQQALTVHLVEVIIIKPKDGKMDDVMDFLHGRQEKLKEDLAFYPAQLTAAEAMIVGNRHNVAYLICHDDAPIAEQSLLKLIDENI